jgi:sensor domain CHASE-containing protein
MVADALDATSNPTREAVMFRRYQIQALIIFTGFVCVMAWEVGKWVMG